MCICITVQLDGSLILNDIIFFLFLFWTLETRMLHIFLMYMFSYDSFQMENFIGNYVFSWIVITSYNLHITFASTVNKIIFRILFFSKRIFYVIFDFHRHKRRLFNCWLENGFILFGLDISRNEKSQISHETFNISVSFNSFWAFECFRIGVQETGRWLCRLIKFLTET